jgi:hypothetical protein
VHSLSDSNTIATKISSIYDTFIREGGKYRLALPSTTRKQIERDMKLASNVDIFAMAYDVILDDLYEALFR